MGRPQFAQPGTLGGGQTVAVQERPEVQALENKSTTTLASGASETLEFYAPTGATYRVLAMELFAGAPSGAASGTHHFSVSPAGSLTKSMKGASAYGDWVNFNYSEWKTATDEQLPSDGAAAVLAIQGMKATENQPVSVHYKNATDVSTSEERTVRLVVEESGY